MPPRGSPWGGSAQGAAADAEGAAAGTDLGAAGAALTGVAEAAPLAMKPRISLLVIRPPAPVPGITERSPMPLSLAIFLTSGEDLTF